MPAAPHGWLGSGGESGFGFLYGGTCTRHVVRAGVVNHRFSSGEGDGARDTLPLFLPAWWYVRCVPLSRVSGFTCVFTFTLSVHAALRAYVRWSFKIADEHEDKYRVGRKVFVRLSQMNST